MFCLFLDCFNKRVNPVLVIPSWLEVESPWLLLRFSFYLQFFFLFQQFDYDVPWYSFLFICVFAWILFDSQIHILRSILHLMWKNVGHRLFKYIFLNSHFHLSVQDSNYTYVRLLDIVLQPTMTVYCFFSVFSFSASSRVAYIAISSSFLLFFFFFRSISSDLNPRQCIFNFEYYIFKFQNESLFKSSISLIVSKFSLMIFIKFKIVVLKSLSTNSIISIISGLFTYVHVHSLYLLIY